MTSTSGRTCGLNATASIPAPNALMRLKRGRRTRIPIGGYYPTDYDPASDEDGPLHLLKCCGTQRPRGKTVIVVVRPAVGSFVAIHDYLSTVHPLLLSSRADLLSAMGDVMGMSRWRRRRGSWSTITCLIIWYVIREQDDWIREVSRPPNPFLASTAT
ncbi:hypothetical protein CGCVW01_v011262 [Colletotrichum viniferum]|nr:hypothetical protein CGCVW01_v011262 [Colletotrichum viniferum]